MTAKLHAVVVHVAGMPVRQPAGQEEQFCARCGELIHRHPMIPPFPLGATVAHTGHVTYRVSSEATCPRK